MTIHSCIGRYGFVFSQSWVGNLSLLNFGWTGGVFGWERVEVFFSCRPVVPRLRHCCMYRYCGGRDLAF